MFAAGFQDEGVDVGEDAYSVRYSLMWGRRFGGKGKGSLGPCSDQSNSSSVNAVTAQPKVAIAGFACGKGANARAPHSLLHFTAEHAKILTQCDTGHFGHLNIASENLLTLPSTKDFPWFRARRRVSEL